MKTLAHVRLGPPSYYLWVDQFNTFGLGENPLAK